MIKSMIKIGDRVRIDFGEEADSMDESGIGSVYHKLTGTVSRDNFFTYTIKLDEKSQEVVWKRNQNTGNSWTLTPNIPKKGYLFLIKNNILKNE